MIAATIIPIPIEITTHLQRIINVCLLMIYIQYHLDLDQICAADGCRTVYPCNQGLGKVG